MPAVFCPCRPLARLPSLAWCSLPSATDVSACAVPGPAWTYGDGSRVVSAGGSRAGLSVSRIAGRLCVVQLCRQGRMVSIYTERCVNEAVLVGRSAQWAGWRCWTHSSSPRRQPGHVSRREARSGTQLGRPQMAVAPGTRGRYGHCPCWTGREMAGVRSLSPAVLTNTARLVGPGVRGTVRFRRCWWRRGPCCRAVGVSVAAGMYGVQCSWCVVPLRDVWCSMFMVRSAAQGCMVFNVHGT